VVRLAKGVDRGAALAELADVGASLPNSVPDVSNLSNVRRLPLYLAGCLVLLGLGAVAHTLASGARRRTRDVAVLRALGLTPRQAGACVAWQATVIGVVAVAIGLPVGVLAGRQVWRLIADSLSFVYNGPFAPGAMLIAVPAVLVAMALLAVWPARMTSRVHTAEVLRRE
jgi:predicted lysophospholipase L1 biosynthesis ABC-type transport system permease subunit